MPQEIFFLCKKCTHYPPENISNLHRTDSQFVTLGDSQDISGLSCACPQRETQHSRRRNSSFSHGPTVFRHDTVHMPYYPSHQRGPPPTLVTTINIVHLVIRVEFMMNICIVRVESMRSSVRRTLIAALLLHHGLIHQGVDRPGSSYTPAHPNYDGILHFS